MGVEICEVRDQILDHRQMWQRADRQIIAWNLVMALGTSQCVAPTNVHGARPTHTFAARTAEGQGRVHRALDMDQGIQHHGATLIDGYVVRVPARVLARLGVKAVNLKCPHFLGIGRGRVMLALGHPRISWKRELDHKTRILIPTAVGVT